MDARSGLVNILLLCCFVNNRYNWPSDFLARLRAPKRQIPQPPALLPSSLPPPSSIPQVFIKYTPYDYTDRQKIREKLYQAALLEPVATQIIEAGAAKRSRERAEVGPAPHGFEYVQVGYARAQFQLNLHLFF
jgi:hypothetical protein